MSDDGKKTLEILCHASGWCSRSQKDFALLKLEATQEGNDKFYLAFRFDGSGWRDSTLSAADESFIELSQAVKHLNTTVVKILYWAKDAYKNNVPPNEEYSNRIQSSSMVPVSYEVPRRFIYSIPQPQPIRQPMISKKGPTIEGAEEIFNKLRGVLMATIIDGNMNDLNSLGLEFKCYKVKMYYKTGCHHLKMYDYKRMFDQTKVLFDDFLYGLVEFSVVLCDSEGEEENAEFTKVKKEYKIKELPWVQIIPTKLYKIKNKFKMERVEGLSEHATEKMSQSGLPAQTHCISDNDNTNISESRESFEQEEGPLSYSFFNQLQPPDYPFTEEYSLFEARLLLIGGPPLDRKQKELDEKTFVLLKMHHNYSLMSQGVHEKRSKEEWFYALFYCFTTHEMATDLSVITSALSNLYLSMIPENNATTILNTIPAQEHDRFVIVPMTNQDVHAQEYIRMTFAILNTMHTSTDGGITNEMCLYHQYLILVAIGKEPFLQRKILELQKSEKYSKGRESLADIEDRIHNLFGFLSDYVERSITTIKFNKNNSHDNIQQFVTQSIAVYERHAVKQKQKESQHYSYFPSHRQQPSFQKTPRKR